MSNGKRGPQFIVAVLATGFAFLTGIALGWPNPIRKYALDGELGFPVSKDEFSWAGSALAIGAVVACIPAGFLIDSLGRKVVAMLSAIPFLLGWAAIIVARKRLIAGRALIGLACGACGVCIPMYIGEIAQKEIRGTLGSFFQLQITMGILWIYVVGAFCKPLIINIVSVMFVILFTISMSYLPESPLFLVRKDKLEKAEEAYKFLRGKGYDSEAEMDAARDETANIKDETSVFDGFKNKACLKALYISVGLMFIQQFSGINAVIFHSTEMFTNVAGILEPRFSTIVMGIVQVIATVMAVLLVDRWGRRLLLLISASFMALSTATLGIYFFIKDHKYSSMDGWDWLLLTALFVYIIAYTFGFGAVPWTMTGELFPLQFKGPVGSLAATSNWLFTFVIGYYYPKLCPEYIGYGEAFWVFSALTILGIIFILFIVPETKKKSLNEIQEMLQG